MSNSTTIRAEKGSFKSPCDGINIATLTVYPAGEPRGIVQLAHGMCEHKGRYLPFMEYLAGRGYLCSMNDHRGHGESITAEPGYFGEDGGRALVEDMHELTKILKKEHKNLPFFLFGHSMGSLAVRCYTKRYDRELDGLIVCGCPSQNPAAGVGSALVSVIKKFKGEHAYSELVHSMADGGFNKAFAGEGSPSAWISSDKEAVAAYDADPLCGFQFTLNGYAALMWLMRDCYSKKGWAVENPDLPVVFVSGADDPCRVSDAKLEDAARAMAAVGYRKPDLRVWPNMRHEVLNEIGHEKVFADLGDTFDEWTEKAAR